MNASAICRIIILAALCAAAPAPALAWNVKGGDVEARIAELQKAWSGKGEGQDAPRPGLLRCAGETGARRGGRGRRG